MSDTQYSIWWLTYKARGGNSVLLKDTAQSHPSRRRERCDYYVHKMMDHTYIPLILPTAVCAAHITYQWQRCNGLQKSNGNLTLIMPHFWFTFESPFDCIRWLLTKKKKKGEKKTRSEYISLELESFPSFRLPWASIYCLIIQSENENWSLKHLYLNKERGAD